MALSHFDILDLEILHIIRFSQQKVSGYLLHKLLIDIFNDNISYGTLYPRLHSLYNRDLLVSSIKAARSPKSLKTRLYSITTLGLTYHERQLEHFRRISDSLNKHKIETISPVPVPAKWKF